MDPTKPKPQSGERDPKRGETERERQDDPRQPRQGDQSERERHDDPTRKY